MIKILDFYADWCKPCKQLMPILNQIQEEEDIILEKINIDTDNSDLMEKYDVQNIPTLLFFKDDILVDKLIGLISKTRIINKLNSLK